MGKTIEVFTLLYVILTIKGCLSSDEYLNTPEEIIEKLSDGRCISAEMRTFLRYVSGDYTKSWLGYVHGTKRTYFDICFFQDPWFEWEGKKFASTFIDALKLLGALFNHRAESNNKRIRRGIIPQ